MKKTIHYEEVARAAEMILTRGEKPSLSNVIEILGLYNKTVELPKLLEQWYSTQPEFQRTHTVQENPTEKKLAEKALKIRERAIESSSHGIFIMEVELGELPKIIYVNPGFEKITGFLESEMLGKYFEIFNALESETVHVKRLELAIREKREEEIELQSVKKSGERFWIDLRIAPVLDQPGIVSHFVGVMTDVTQRKTMEQQLAQQATHDFLTHLPNRVLLMDRVEQAILQTKRNKQKLALLFLDLDRFKLINDSLGHSIGDLLLQNVSNRLLLCTRENDTVARLGGDEFVIALTQLHDEKDVLPVAENILEAMSQPFYVEKHEFLLTASMGIACYPRDGKDYETLLKNADVSMYQAKDAGRNNYQLFTRAMDKKAGNRLTLEHDLRRALERSELSVHYQPLIALREHHVIGHEALLRWDNERIGKISPLEFIPIAEETGLIIEIGQWVLEEACKQALFWHAQGYLDWCVAVNLSGRQFNHKNLAQTIQTVLATTGLASQFLEVELTESLLIEDLATTLDTLHALKDMGVSIAIDDFGTGYSSLSYLKQFPIDKLKINHSFICDFAKESNARAIAVAIINLAHSLNLSVLAEGVEYECQAKFLRENHCDFAQGFYFQKPTPAGTLLTSLRESPVMHPHSVSLQLP